MEELRTGRRYLFAVCPRQRYLCRPFVSPKDRTVVPYKRPLEDPKTANPTADNQSAIPHG